MTLHLAVALDGTGWHPASWREPGARADVSEAVRRIEAPGLDHHDGHPRFLEHALGDRTQHELADRGAPTHADDHQFHALLLDRRKDVIGGLSAATVGVILRSLITFSDQGADAFFGEPDFDTADLLRVTGDGRGVVSLLVDMPWSQKDWFTALRAPDTDDRDTVDQVIALRRALEKLHPEIRDMHLTDFKVRILDGEKATGATTRVLLDATDGHRTWGAIGVHENIIEASWEALVSSLEAGMLARRKIVS